METKHVRMGSLLVGRARAVLRLLATAFGNIANANTNLGPSSDTQSSGILSKAIGWPPPKLDPSRETAWLDGLRGTAAFFVMAFHFNQAFLGLYTEAPYGSTLLPHYTVTYAIWRLPFIRFFITSGHAQVSVFFVLSGLVLSWSSFDRIRAGQGDKLLATLSSATARRWVRLYFPCFVVGFLSFLGVVLGYQPPPTVRVYPSIIRQFWDYVLACETFARPWIRDRKYPDWLHSYSWIMWTIPLEFEGSLLVFVLLLSLARVKSYGKRCFVLVFLAIYACKFGHWTYWLFTTGILIADYVKHFGGFARLTQGTIGLYKLGSWLCFVGGIWMAGVPNPNPEFYNKTGYEFLDKITPSAYDRIEAGARFWWSMAGILIVFGGCHLQPVRSLCESKLARYLGRISYMLYLSHSGFPLGVGLAFRRWFSEIWGTKRYDQVIKADVYDFTLAIEVILFCLSWIVCIIPAVFVAHWCEVLVDRPSVNLSKWIEMWFIDGNSNTLSSHAARVNEAEGLDSEGIALLPVYRNVNVE